MSRPALPKHLKRSVAIFTAFRESEADFIDDLIQRHELGSRAEVVREVLLSYKENRAPTWDRR